MANFKNNLPGCAASGCTCAGGGTYCVTIASHCSPAPSGVTITFTDSGGTTQSPVSTTAFGACFALPVANGTLTFTVPSGYANPGPIVLGSSPGSSISVSAEVSTITLTNSPGDTCCGYFVNQTLTYSPTFSGTFAPTPHRAGWFSSLKPSLCGGPNFINELTCPADNTSGFWQLSQVDQSGFTAGTRQGTINFNTPPSSVVITSLNPAICPNMTVNLT